jgi:uncharacterized membrane protein
MTDTIIDDPHDPHDAPTAERAAVEGGDDRRGPARWWAQVRSTPGTVLVQALISLGIVGGCIVFIVLRLQPDALFSSSTPAGGDMGAHVWGPAYLRDVLLPQGRLSGWTTDWYAGFPAYQFYMVVPSLLIAVLSYVLPYGLAFKLVVISGLVSLPVAAWSFGRLTRLPFPGPPLLAVGATVFLFDRSFSILGGNMASTMAGEFAFSMSLSLALIYLGVLDRGLATGKHRGWAAVLLALTGLCHLIPAFFALIGTVVIVALHPGSRERFRRIGIAGLALAGAAGLALATVYWRDAPPRDEALEGFGAVWRSLPPLVQLLWVGVALGLVVWLLTAPGRGRWRWLLTTMPVAAALSAFWVLPFYAQSRFLNDMGWERKANVGDLLFQRETLDSGLVDSPPIEVVLALAAVGVLLSIVFRRRLGVILAVSGGILALAVANVPDGRLWNVRLLPFWYLCLYLLAAVGIAEFIRVLAAVVARDPRRPVQPVAWSLGVVATLVALAVVAMPLQAMPFGSKTESGGYRWLFFETDDNSFVDSWARWNFEGYEGKPAWPEYRDLVATMGQVGKDRGCGRAMWEHEPQHDRYGTPMALMLLPFWTESCIGSMEGLYFEASATTPYHFLNQDQLSAQPSNAQRDMPYTIGAPTPADFDLGVDHLQLMGVRYYLAISESMQQLADAHPDLTEVAASGPWVVYEVADAPLVRPLVNEPVVVEGADVGGRTWQDLAVAWYQDPTRWDVAWASDGPDDWQRVPMLDVPDDAVRSGDGAGVATEPEVRPVRPVVVSDVDTAHDAISFSVDQPGSPVLVSASYFPNWHVEGADGPYRVAPNLMVVVPTRTDVVLSYGWTGVDGVAWLLTGAGIVGLFLLVRARRRPVPVPAGSFWAEDGDGDPWPWGRS